MAEASNQNLKLSLKLNYVSKVLPSQLTSTLLQSSCQELFPKCFLLIRQQFQTKMFLKEQY